MIFGLVTAASFVLSAAYWKTSQLDYDTAMTLQKVRLQYDDHGDGRDVLPSPRDK